jgi:molecular chaperone DnaJ
MPSDHYIVLGIERGADLRQIKRAYRKAIKRYHPDRVGSDMNMREFIASREAYEVLSDDDKRRDYDDMLRAQGASARIPNPREAIGRKTGEWRALRESASLVDAFFGGIVPGFFGPTSRSRSRAAAKDLYMEVILTPAEARYGGVFPVTVPIVEPCPNCRGSGAIDGFYCPYCVGYGAVDSQREVNLTIPPGTRAGTTAVPLDGIGVRDANLYVDVRVGLPPAR